MSAAFVVRFVQSLAGRLVIILTIGISVSAISSLAVAEHYRLYEFRVFRAERIALSAADVFRRFDEAPGRTRALLDSKDIIGAHSFKGRLPHDPPADELLQAALTKHLSAARQATGYQGRIEDCFGPLTAELKSKFSRRAAGFLPVLPECWVVSGLGLKGGTRTFVAFDMPALRFSRSTTLNPTYLLMIVIAAAILSLLVSHIALRSLRTLTAAAHAFSNDIDAEPIAEAGPADVREAFVAFNIMQNRVREGVRERTRILAAISHDLQTPLTRMRLRFEAIEDSALRQRLVDDLAMMLRLVREGLSLARSSRSADDWTMLDLDSLVASLVDDAVETGLEIRSVTESGATILTRPDALTRVLENLISNAIRYGDRAEISTIQTNTTVRVEIRDNGPGIPDDQLERMFDPFVRGETSRSRETGGAGIGLTIARAQAKTFGGFVELSDLRGGGLLATLTIPRIGGGAAGSDARSGDEPMATRRQACTVPRSDNVYQEG